MKLLKYDNINTKFTYNNVCLNLDKFWTNEVKNINKPKIWLTLIVFNNKNISFTLFKDLPFNTADYNDVLIVLKGIFIENLLIDRKDEIKNISFKYQFEGEINEKKINKYMLMIFMVIILSTILSTLIIVIIIMYLIDINSLLVIDQPGLIVEKAKITTAISCNEDIKVEIFNTNIFTDFLSLFNKSSNRYFPSYFLESNLHYSDNDFSLLEFIIYNQYNILEYHTYLTSEYINNLYEILEEYSRITNRI